MLLILEILLSVCIFIPQNASASVSVLEVPDPLPLALPTRNIDPESYDDDLKIKTGDEKNSLLWADFVRGNLWSKDQSSRSCPIFLKLAEEADFPLRPIAYIKAAQVCTFDTALDEKLLTNIDNYIKSEKPPRWLKVSLLEAQAGIASHISDEAFVSRALEAASLEKTKKARADLLTQALPRAKKISREKGAEVETELLKISKAYKAKPSSSDWLILANEAFLSHDYETAEKNYKKVFASPSYPMSIKRVALDQLRQTYKIAQNRKKALAAAERLWKWDTLQLKSKRDATENIRHYVLSGMTLARMHWTEHRNKQARKILSKLLKTKGVASLSDVYFVLARMDEEEGQDAKALSEMEEAIKRSTDPRAPKSQYQWPYAWLSFKQKKYDQALTTLTALSQVETDTGKKAQQLFWLAQIYKASGKPDQAKPILEKIINDDPLSYYTLLSYRDLQRPIPKLDKPATETSKDKPSLKKLSKLIDVNWNLFRWLVATGELGYARQFLNEEVPIPDPSVMKDWKEIFQQYAQARYLSPLFGSLNKLSAEEKLDILTNHKGFLFPTPYVEMVDDAADRSGLWPEFIFSIMRQESSFDTSSVSPANAYGLLQLLPGVARQVGKANHIKFRDNSDLLEPSINIPLGAFLLRSYWDIFDGQFLLATAAYNASPDSVRSWMATRYHGDVLQFIEDIPYEETRTYVKLVLRNFINYLRINTSNTSLPFPEWCLQGLQVSN